jgi:hypothetical protein
MESLLIKFEGSENYLYYRDNFKYKDTFSMKKPAITEQPIHSILADRWSSRAYDPTQFVSQELLLSLMEAEPFMYGRSALAIYCI